ncbi:MAG: hypothetical protein ABIQ39_05800, partial [Ilumatobacteraceae bacterium]
MQSQHCNKRPRALIRLIVAVVVALSSVPATGVSAESGQTADQVADQIVAVQAQADDVAAQWVDRDADAKRLAIEVDAATQAVKAAAATTKAMSATLTKLAVDRYTSAIG